MHQKKRVGKLLLLIIVLALALAFTAVAQAGGGGQPVPPVGKPHQVGRPPIVKPPPTPELANCIDVIAWYDGNFNGVIDANENPLDGTSIRLMVSYPPPSTEPPIGPDGKPMIAPMQPMGPYGGPAPHTPAQDGGFAKFQLLDHKLTRDGGVTRFCDLKPGQYILQGDAPGGITYGDNRQYTILEAGGYQIISFGFSRLDEDPAALNGSGA